MPRPMRARRNGENAMNKCLAIAAVSVAGLAATPSPAAAWTLLGTREVLDRTDHDAIVVAGNRKFDRIKICVYRNPVHFIDVDVYFKNGGHQDVSVAQRINPGDCTRSIDLNGDDRNITRVDFVYEETSFRRARARVKLFGE